MREIKFSGDYHKLPKGETTATLVGVKVLHLEAQTKWFLEYDTTHLDGTRYPLPKAGVYLLLEFMTPSSAFFTTLRRYTQEKMDYYKKQMGMEFNIRKE